MNSDVADLAILVVRMYFGITLALHGWNKVRSRAALDGTAGWFASIGMRNGRIAGVLAATTEISAGAALAVGLLTPLAAAATIGIMLVATVVAHAKNGFFIFRPGQGWEYTAAFIVVAAAIAGIGPGRFSIDSVMDISFDPWVAFLGALGVGVVGAGAQLLVMWRPPRNNS
jgi:putative oxidoreductase